VIVAKAIAARVVVLGEPEPVDLLSGRPFAQAGIAGAVESDFFDWVLARPAGVDLIRRIVRQVGRFRLAAIETDVLKVLYESLVDPAQRHDLGEYYTPDWLAPKICRAAIKETAHRPRDRSSLRFWHLPVPCHPSAPRACNENPA